MRYKMMDCRQGHTRFPISQKIWHQGLGGVQLSTFQEALNCHIDDLEMQRWRS